MPADRRATGARRRTTGRSSWPRSGRDGKAEPVPSVVQREMDVRVYRATDADTAAVIREDNRLRRAEERKRCKARDFGGALALYESEERAPTLRLWRTRYGMTTDELRAVLAEWWNMIEAWSTPQWNEVKLSWLRETGYLSDSERELAGELTIYRGNLGEPEPAGMSRTLSRALGQQFALVASSSRGAYLGMHGRNPVPTVWRATVASSDVLGYFVDRDEDEVVAQRRCATSR
jgi:hypothetical protein